MRAFVRACVHACVSLRKEPYKHLSYLQGSADSGWRQSVHHVTSHSINVKQRMKWENVCISLHLLYMHVCVFVRVNVYMCTHVCMYASPLLYMHTHKYIYLYIQTRTHIYIYLYIYMYTVYIRTCTCMYICRNGANETKCPRGKN